MESNNLPLPLSAVAAQLRALLENAHLAAVQLYPPSARETDPALDAQAAVMDRNFFRLLRLADNLSMAIRLSLSDELPLQDADIVDLVGDVCDRTGSLMALSGLRLRFLCAPDSHICAFAPTATEQLLYHLLSNALKFSPVGGTVEVALRFTACRVFLSVADRGCGIPENGFPAWFVSDPQAPPLPPHGTGLGLTLCQRIARYQGGMLLAESRPGKGSRFTLSLPDRRCGKAAAPLPFDSAGGFNPTLVALADALPPEAFLLRSQG